MRSQKSQTQSKISADRQKLRKKTVVRYFRRQCTFQTSSAACLICQLQMIFFVKKAKICQLRILFIVTKGKNCSELNLFFLSEPHWPTSPRLQPLHKA